MAFSAGRSQIGASPTISSILSSLLSFSGCEDKGGGLGILGFFLVVQILTSSVISELYSEPRVDTVVCKFDIPFVNSATSFALCLFC